MCRTEKALSKREGCQKWEECAEGTHSRRDGGGVGAEQQREADTGIQNFGSCVVIWALSWQWETEKVWGSNMIII